MRKFDLTKPVQKTFQGQPYTKEELRATLPKVGDRLMKAPTLSKSCHMTEQNPRPCVVVYVNAKRFWYMVRFDKGYYQSYKLPEKGETK